MLLYNLNLISEVNSFASLQKFMKVIIKAKPGAKHDDIEKIDEMNYVVSVIAPPVDGKANAAIIKMLAKHFDVSQSLVEIISGHFSRTKVLEIHNGN